MAMLTQTRQFVAALLLTFIVGGAIGYLAAPSAEPSATTAALPMKNPLDPLRSATSPETREESGRDAAATPTSGGEIAVSLIAAGRARDYFQRRHDTYAIGQKLDRDTIRAALDATQAFPKKDRDNAEYVLLARWLELDPAAAYGWVQALPAKSDRTSLRREFFHSLGLKDPAMALKFLNESRSDPHRGEDPTSSVFEAWSSFDPTAAVDAAFGLEKKQARDSALGVALGRLAQSDPQAALARVAQFPDPEMRQNQMRNVLRKWAEQDPQAATNHVLNLPAGRERNEAMASVVGGVAVTDGEAAIRLAEQLPPGSARSQTLSQVISSIGYEEPKVAAELVLMLPPGQQRNSIYQIISRLAREDRPAALDWAGRLGSAEARDAALSGVVRQWAADDPKAAAQYCVTNSVTNDQAMREAVSNWAQDDSRGALAWAGALPAGTQRDTALSGAIGVLAANDPRQAASLAATMLTGDSQSNALGIVAARWAVRDPNAAIAWATQLSDPNVRQNTLDSVASTWAGQDPAAAASWATRSTETMSALPNITRQWAEQDPAATAKWLDTLPAGTGRDSALAAFSTAVVNTDPEGAVAWAATISEAQQRESTIGQIFSRWVRTDPKSAKAWLQSTPALSEEARRRMAQ